MPDLRIHGSGMTGTAEITVDPEAIPLEVEDFLTHLTVEKGRSTNTLAAYRRDLRRYLAFLGARRETVRDATTAGIVAYVHALRGEGLAPASVARMTVAVRGLHRFLLAEDHLERDPAADVEAPGVPRGLPKALTEEQVTRLIDAVAGDTAVARRDRAILEVLYGCGIRISELTGLSLGDVDLDASIMRVFGKGSKERVVPLGRFAARALDAWLSAPGRGALEPERWRRRDDSDAVFLNARGGRLSRQGAWGVVHKYGEIVGLTDVLTPHVLRHSCATHMLDHGADIRTVQELLGHASISTTQIYTKVANDRLVQVYLDAHPRARAAPQSGKYRARAAPQSGKYRAREEGHRE
jgi:integrase/recombinase XerD